MNLERTELLARFDAQVRRDPVCEPGAEIDRSGSLVRVVGSRSWISAWEFSSEDATSIVQREMDRFRSRRSEVEWKVYGHDLPVGLADILAEHGFRADEPETLMILEIPSLATATEGSGDIRIQRVRTEAELRTAVQVSEEAFAPEPGWELGDYLPRLSDPSMQIHVAFRGDRPVSAGRVELPPHREFASLWGGGTVPASRGQGVYRALVTSRADAARAQGYRFLTVDARETSRPILERIGFRPMTSIVGWVLRP